VQKTGEIMGKPQKKSMVGDQGKFCLFRRTQLGETTLVVGGIASKVHGKTKTKCMGLKEAQTRGKRGKAGILSG